MKNVFYFVSFLLVICETGFAQDLIVTQSGDSLNRKITKVRSDFIYFVYRYEEDVKSDKIPVSQVSSFKVGYFEKTNETSSNIKANATNEKFRLIFTGGLSYLTGRIDPDLPPHVRKYLEELKTGYHFGGDAAYFFTDKIGAGLKYSIFKTSNETRNVEITNNVTQESGVGVLRDDVTIQYIGPAFCMKFLSGKKKTQLISDISIGYLSYYDKATLLNVFTLRGETLGMLLDFGAYYSIYRDLSIGFQFDLILGALGQVDYEDRNQSLRIKFSDDRYESISRMDFAIGVKWNY